MKDIFASLLWGIIFTVATFAVVHFFGLTTGVYFLAFIMGYLMSKIAIRLM